MLYKEFDNKSLLDYIKDIMPNINIIDIKNIGRPLTYSKAAKGLFSLWRDESNKISSNLLKRPVTISATDVDLMEQEGLIKRVGNDIQITSRGAEVIKTMILGDDKSSYEDDGSIMDYSTAYANTKPRRMVKGAKAASTKDKGNWYKKIH